MALKLTVNDLSEVPEAAQALYIPTEDGSGYRLDVEQPAPAEQRLSATIAESELVRLLDASGANGFLMAPHLAERVKAVVDDMGAVKINYYSEQGNPQTVEQFKKDVLDNPRFSRLITGSKASGGGGFITDHQTGQQRQIKAASFPNERLSRARDLLAGKSGQ